MVRLFGITPCLDPGLRWRPGRDYLYIARAYSQAIARAGGVPVLLTPDTPLTIARTLAGLVISGGDDLPTRFGEEHGPPPLGAAEVEERVRWERCLLDATLGEIPVLGICYGMQLINLHLGGSLYGALSLEHPGALDHGGSGRLTHHDVVQFGESPYLADLPSRFTTNSSHGQAVAELAPGLRGVARSEDGVLEAFDGPGVLGIEWHPEVDQTGEAIFARFVREGLHDLD